jgi:Universal stress protein family
MSAEPGETRVTRILVPLDASPASVAAAAAAAAMAARLSAELEGLFVEDADLLALASFPFAGEVVTFTATLRGLGAGDLERQLRFQAERARRALERHATHFQVRWTFRVVRGRVKAEVLAAAEGAVLVSLGRSAGWTGRRRLGSVARALLAHGSGRVLLLPHDHPAGPLRPPAVAVYAGDAASKDALTAAAEFVGAGVSEAEGRLVVLLAAAPAAEPADSDRPDRSDPLRAEVEDRIAGTGITPRIQRLPSAAPAALARAVTQARGRILFLPTTAPVLAHEDLSTLVERLDCAVMLVR